MLVIPIALYVAACCICGLMGRRTAFGFFGHFLLAFLLTPFADLLILLAGRPSRKIRDQIERLEP